MKKNFRKLHLWLGLPFGLIISLICFSGAMLLIEPEVTAWLQPEFQSVSEIKDKRLPADVLVEKVAATIPDSVQVTGITFSTDPTKPATVNLSQPRRASVSINQYTGEVIGQSKRVPFFFTMFRLHRWLLDSYKPTGFSLGKLVTGVSTLMFVFVLISGLVIWWPKTRQALRNRLTVKTDKGRHRLFYDLHAAGGFYASILLLVMALTGLTWSFDWYRAGFYKVFGVEMAEGGHGGPSGGRGEGRGRGERGGRGEGREGKGRGERGGRGEGRGEALPAGKKEAGKFDFGPSGSAEVPAKYPASIAVWDAAYEQVASDNIDKTYKAITISDGEASLSLGGYGNQRAADQYKYDTATGQLLSVERYADMDNSSKIRGWVYTAHTFSWGGWFTRLPALLAVLIGFLLPLTGCYLWWKRTFRKKNK